jgi:drug/metabolite transporter (DMT)-like permease
MEYGGRPVTGYATLALVAFAANSILCRLALRDDHVDPATFSTIRLISGAAVLWLMVTWKPDKTLQRTGSWASAAMLSLYAVPFSFAYTTLSTGTGALLLFGSVQATMLVVATRSGERPRSGAWFGLGMALAGLVCLVLPGLEAPSVPGAMLMGIAGVSWGAYSWRGRNTASPLAQTAANFSRSVPLVILVSLASLGQFHLELEGLLLAVASGGLASGLGYVAWYAALRRLTAVRASVLQLAVPVLAAVGGVVFLREAISTRLIVSTTMVLGGIALAIISREASSE